MQEVWATHVGDQLILVPLIVPQLYPCMWVALTPELEAQAPLQHTLWACLVQILIAPCLARDQRSIPADGSPERGLKPTLWTYMPKAQFQQQDVGSLLEDAGACRVVSCQVSHPTGQGQGLPERIGIH